MSKSPFHKFIDKLSGPKFDCGTYHYSSAFLGLNRMARMKIPADMHKDGLLILGCHKSYRRRFANQYANQLIQQGKKVLYITDVLSTNRYRLELESKWFRTHLGIDNLDNNMLHVQSLEDDVDSKAFDAETKLSILHYDSSRTLDSDDALSDFDNKVLNVLRSLESANVSATETVVFIDEDVQCRSRRDNKHKELLKVLQELDDGYVICGHSDDARWYTNIKGIFKHQIIFRVRDPLDIDKIISSLSPSMRDKKFTREYHHACPRDFAKLYPKEFVYMRQDVCGLSLVVSYDGGCECCIPPADDYYGYKPPKKKENKE